MRSHKHVLEINLLRLSRPKCNFPQRDAFRNIDNNFSCAIRIVVVSTLCIKTAYIICNVEENCEYITDAIIRFFPRTERKYNLK